MASIDARGATSESQLLRGLSDADLLVLISFGDLDALGVVYDRYADAAWRVAVHFSDDVAAAEEAVATVFVRLWCTAAAADQTSLAAWLRSSVAREARALQQVEGGERSTTPEREIMAAVNGVIDDVHRSLGIEESEFFCECGRTKCRERLTLSRGDYGAVRQESRSIVVEAHADRDTAGEPARLSQPVFPVRAVPRASE